MRLVERHCTFGELDSSLLPAWYTAERSQTMAQPCLDGRLRSLLEQCKRLFILSICGLGPVQDEIGVAQCHQCRKRLFVVAPCAGFFEYLRDVLKPLVG